MDMFKTSAIAMVGAFLAFILGIVTNEVKMDIKSESLLDEYKRLKCEILIENREYVSTKTSTSFQSVSDKEEQFRKWRENEENRSN